MYYHKKADQEIRGVRFECYLCALFVDLPLLLGPHLNFSGKVVPVVLKSFVSGFQMIFPPVNWASVLGPLMRSNFGKPISY